ncbi:YsnF/AvaK domain-containing protein [Flaviaesturariibacter amylovorans]|uniref:DUF2382 domain-containing protein n=1 Tax=Flaviaesturariibacter amylovorans TaxID=1084520 RepID=A0ABP8H7V6_9BACT
MSQTVIGLFDEQSQAQRAVEQLEARGIGRDRVDVSRSGSGAAGSTATKAGADRNTDHVTGEGRTVDEKGRNTNAITDFFNNLFGGSDKDESDRYSRVAERASAIVTVHARDAAEARVAADILDNSGAIDVDDRARSYGVGNTRSAEAGHRGDVSADRGTTIPRVEEHLEVGKREVEGGGVRVRSRIVERPVEEHVRLREEHVHIEREPVNRPVSDADRSAFQDRDIEVREHNEVPVVNKDARVVEEVRVSKEVTERDETIRDTVRNTEINVDRTGSSDRGTTDRSGNTDRNIDPLQPGSSRPL